MGPVSKYVKLHFTYIRCIYKGAVIQDRLIRFISALKENIIKVKYDHHN